MCAVRAGLTDELVEIGPVRVSISPGGRTGGRGGGERLGSEAVPAEGLLLHSLVTQPERGSDRVRLGRSFHCADADAVAGVAEPGAGARSAGADWGGTGRRNSPVVSAPRLCRPAEWLPTLAARCRQGAEHGLD
ncbi:hypothetical protein [Frankia sp. R43]|uniref:hypothetical protein n=1 Tax=Frankia sp. R43 TaxID=269536 RepID=UPI0006CA4ABE|nr:hypothetical protein [Frankia sp. R43]